jgi:acyl-CoA synthetase (NDP forming)
VRPLPPLSVPEAAIDPELLRTIFNPRSIAIIGAKDGRQHFLGSGAVVQALHRLGYDGDLHLVARSGAPAFGRPTVARASDIGAKVDHAAVAVPVTGILDVLPDLAAAGIPALTTLASGFAETGEQGRQRQLKLSQAAAEYGITVIGPNCLGFVNFVDRTGVWFSGLPETVRTGSVAILSQSGGVGDALMEYASNLGIGLSYLITTGNEPCVTITDALGFAVEDPSTRVVAVFAEALKKPSEFLRITGRARELGKAIVMLKAGASERAARNAISHTASLVGDDRVTDAVLKQAGVVRVSSLEELLTTAHLIAEVGAVPAAGVGVISLSGGSCSIFADAAAAARLEVPDFSARTVTALRQCLGGFATPQNPLDVTGAAGEQTFEEVLRAVSQQPDIGLLAVMCNVPTHESGATDNVIELLQSIGRGMRQCGRPAVLISQTSAHLHPFGRNAIAASGIDVALPGLQLASTALERLTWWSGQVSQPGPVPRPAPPPADGELRLLSEWQARGLLAGHGVPLVPARLVTSPAQAADAAEQFDVPVVVKVVSPDLAHKSDIGGVRLSVRGRPAAMEAFEAVTAAGRGIPGARIHGAIVSPMRGSGIEMIVGVTRDEQWGLTLLTGLGGVTVEVYADTAQRVLPVDLEEIGLMLAELRGRSLLGGYRGGQAADLDGLARAIHSVTAAALALGDRLQALEINPLLVHGAQVEALDVLVVLREGKPTAGEEPAWSS